MQEQREIDPVMGELYLAGEIVPAGSYQLVGTDIKILLEEDGRLPASLDGRVACYELVQCTWHQHQKQKEAQSAHAGH